MKLSEIMVGKVKGRVEHPEFPGFFVDLNLLSSTEQANLRKRCTETVITDIRYKVKEEKLNEEKYNEEFAREVIAGWSGLKLDYLQMLLPISVTPEALEEVLPYSQEDATGLLTHSPAFNIFIIEALNDLDNFRIKPKARAVAEAREVSSS